MGPKRGDGIMDKTLIFIAAAALLAGVATFFYLNQNGYPIIETLTGIPNQIVQTYMLIPETIRGIIQIGIPSAFAMFFAWTKLRVVDQAKQAQQTFTEQLTQAEGEKHEMQQQLEQQAASGLQGIMAERDAALTSRDEAQTLVATLQQQLRDKEQRSVGEMEAIIAEKDKLQAQLEKLKPNPVK